MLVTSNPDDLRTAERIVLPGVGAFKDCRDGLKAVPACGKRSRNRYGKGQAFLGICCSACSSWRLARLEHDVTEGFGWIPGDVKPISPRDPSFKIRTWGGTRSTAGKPHALLDGIALGENGLHAYFVHSYHLDARDAAMWWRRRSMAPP